MKPFIDYDMPNPVYHARPELSSSQARTVFRSPRTYLHELNVKEAKRAYDVGEAAHTKILGVGNGTITYPQEHLTPSGNVSTKAATLKWAEEQRALGLTPISPEDARLIDGMAEALLAEPKARALLEGARVEVSMFGTCPDTDVDIRARLDGWSLSDVIFDVKTTRSSDPVDVQYEVVDRKRRYHAQLGHYDDTARLNGIEPQGVALLFVEKTAPFLPYVYELPEELLKAGRAFGRRAREIYRECKLFDTWPAYSRDYLESLPPIQLSERELAFAYSDH